MSRHPRAGGQLIKTRSPKTRKHRPASKDVLRPSTSIDKRTKVASLSRELNDSLEQQAATREILRVISSSPTDIQPVFNTIANSGARLCKAQFCYVFRFDGELLHFAAEDGLSPEGAKAIRSAYPIAPGRASAAARSVLSGAVEEIPDVDADPHYEHGRVAKVMNFRSIVAVPMLKDGRPIGAIAMARTQAGRFPERQIELLQTFAAQAVIAIENARLLNELRESLEQQTATSEVLRVISSSPTSLQPVFDSIAESAVRLCSGQFGFVIRFENKVMSFASCFGLSAEGLEVFRNIFPRAASDDTAAGRAISRRAIVEIPDVEVDAAYGVQGQHLARTVSYRSIVGVPLLHEGNPIGAIAVARANAGRFPERQIALLQAFSDQAVIAIRNVRLFDEVQARTNDLTESLEQQTATSEVLKVISSSPGELQPVFHAMLENATRICEASFGNLLLREGDTFRRVATHNAPPNFAAFTAKEPLIHRRRSRSLNRLIETKQADLVADMAVEEPETPIVKFGGARTLVTVPMLKENELIGAIGIYRQEVRPFTNKQIENTRLLNELRQSLQQQTATADVLKVISRSAFDLQTVLDTLTESAAQLCEADMAAVAREKDAAFYYVTSYGFPADYLEFIKSIPHPVNRKSVIGRVLMDGKAVQLSDVLADAEYGYLESQKKGGYRTFAGVPLIREGTPIGVLLLGRSNVRPFTQKQIELLSTFADQAVIAIENARLLNELRQRTDDLTESLEQQTATSKVLDVISRSAFDLQAVFETVAESSVRLCGADRAFIFRFDGELLRMAVAFNAASTEWKEYVAQNPTRPGRNSAAARAALERRTVHIPDVLVDPEYSYGAKDVEKVRTVLGVPILKGDDLLGVMVIYHLEVRPFTDKQIALVETFADQAAIAIDNVRLLDALRHRTDELGRSVGELQALGEVSQAVNSTLDLETVLSTIVAKAARLSGTEAGAIYGYDERAREFRLRATYGMDQALIDALTQRHIGLDDPNVAEVFAQREPLQVADLKEEAASELNKIALRAGYRARMVAPLLRGEDIVGMLVVRRARLESLPRTRSTSSRHLQRNRR